MPSAELLHLAEAGIGAVWVGIPAHSVLQAVTLPPAPAMLPRRHGALLGVIEHEGRLVPVVDLARWVDVGTAPEEGRPGSAAAARVLILHAGGRTIGLKADTVGGLAEVAAHTVTRLHHDDCEDEVFHCVVREPASGRILSLLDVERLARLAAAWHQDAGCSPDSGMPAATADAPPPGARSYAVLQAGADRLALAADALTEVLPMPALEPLGAGMGYCTWRGRHVPVLAHAALGLEALADGAAPALLAIVEHGGLALGLPVHAALSLQTVDTAGLEAADGLLSTLFDADGAPLRLLDEARLFARFSEAELSRDAGTRIGAGAGLRAGAGHGHEQDRRAANATAYIVFEGDGMFATAIDTVERIVSLREAATDGNGAMAWEGRTIPMRDLRTGDAAAVVDAARGDVMVVRSGGACVGYVVSRVHLLLPPGSGRVYRMGGAGAGWEFIATSGDDAPQASYRIVELGALAA
ncbi:chemotaxis protein CheW [Massilia sp. IC2-278]|uniref:chemotaxis protein CheW n=1 Tax=Massilia sp. IC2-278 TaxID=2887200 RepID=UPI001E4362EC|nr:chemotaxis protein CheW [Massilia sp. IC2-278]MCC2962687.1 chemotaxis protein CheW [Massilia sp. IC2-278]